MPLGLELAAAWLSILPPEKIAREIERGLDILTTRYQNVPERHRSIRAVFEHSWQMLAGQEQNMLKGLAVFKGSFTQEAAEQVAGASLLSMVTLVDKSLLGVTAAGRYHLHELLRQFAMEKLQARPEEEKATKTRHSAYYLGFISSREARLTGQSQQAALVEIAEEINNVRTGWDWAVKQGQFEAIERALETLYHFYWDRSLLQKGREVFKQAAERLEISNLADLKDRPGLRLRAKLLARQGAFCYALSLYEAATELLQTALALGQELAAQAEIAFCLNFLGNIARNQGDYPAAEQKYQEGLVITKAIADQASTAFNLYSLGFIGEVKGEYSLAKQYYLESLALNRAISNQLGIAQGLDKMGVVSFALGEYTQAEQYYRESLALFEQLNNRLGMALALGGLGLVAWGLGGPKLIEAKQYFETSLAACQESGNRLQMVVRLALLGYVHNSLGHYELAQQHCQEAITLAREIGFKAGLSFALNALGEAACGRSDFLAARRYLDEALETALHSQNHADVLAILVNWAALLVKEERLAAPKQPGATGRMAQAVEILAFAGNHPTNRRIFKDKAAGLVAELELELGVTIVAKIKERGQSRTLAEVVAEIL
jgi:tetratricopeptide (TPR) repeat protein